MRKVRCSPARYSPARIRAARYHEHEGLTPFSSLISDTRIHYFLLYQECMLGCIGVGHPLNVCELLQRNYNDIYNTIYNDMEHLIETYFLLIAMFLLHLPWIKSSISP